MIINNKETKNFPKYQKIPTRFILIKNFQVLFSEEPIVHGANLALIALSKFWKKKKKIFL